MVLYDTPGILPPSEDPKSCETVETIIRDLATPSNRTLICVEPTTQWDNVMMPEYIRHFDPRHERSIFIFTFFTTFLSNIRSPADLHSFLRGSTRLPLRSGNTLQQHPNKYLPGPITDKVFFITSFSGNSRPEKPQVYSLRLNANTDKNLEALETLQYDRSFAERVGATSFRRRITLVAWARYQAVLVPRVLTRLRVLKRELAAAQEAAEAAAREAESAPSMRRAASTRVSAYLGTLGALLRGDVRGRPCANGQTMAEEWAEHGEYAADFSSAPRWLDGRRAPIEIDAASIPGAEERLYGKPQFARLLAQFRAAAAKAATLEEVADDEVATALGASRADAAPDIAWAAADIAQARGRAALAPLVEQLVERAKYVLRRVADIAGRLPSGGWGEKPEDEFPPFATQVRDAFYGVVDEAAAKCLDVCMKEFYGTLVVHWDLTANHAKAVEKARKSLNSGDNEENGGNPAAAVSTAVKGLARMMFEEIKKRVVDNVVLHCYDRMLVDVLGGMMVSVQTMIAKLSDKELADLLEMGIVRENIAKSIESYESAMEGFVAQEEAFVKAAELFSQNGAGKKAKSSSK